MEWATIRFRKSKVDRAGTILINKLVSPEEQDNALEVLNNWRAVHAFPLNTFQISLRRYAAKIDKMSITAQRLKRKSSILYKLKRFEGMQLSRMQDIGGCRAVVVGIRNVKDLHNSYKKSDIKHKLVNEKDYISEPKSSGYRGIHMIYRYYSDRNNKYNGLQIEIQLRTRVQHAWATSVEIIGTFIQRSLKSSVGPEKWLRFFSLMGSVFAIAEKSPLVPGTPTKHSELKAEVNKLVKELKVAQKLESYGRTLRAIDDRKIKHAHFYLMHLNTKTKKLSVRSYKKDESEKANADYLEVEKKLSENKGSEAVLVSVDSIESLKAAYPNYYLDTTRFLMYLKTYLKRGANFS